MHFVINQRFIQLFFNLFDFLASPMLAPSPRRVIFISAEKHLKWKLIKRRMLSNIFQPFVRLPSRVELAVFLLVTRSGCWQSDSCDKADKINITPTHPRVRHGTHNPNDNELGNRLVSEDGARKSMGNASATFPIHFEFFSTCRCD